MSVEIRNLTKKYGNVIAVNDVSSLFDDGKITVLLGPSGCGKTTTLRCIAGLEKPDGGEIYIDKEIVNQVPAEKGT